MKVYTTGNGEYGFYCEGCECDHVVNTQKPNENGAIWKFNGDMNNPTFTPSIQVWAVPRKGEKISTCHFTITNGQIKYQKDCLHKLKEQTIDMEEIQNT